MDGFDAVTRVARLGLSASAEGIETLEHYVDLTAAAYGRDVTMVVLPEQILLTDNASGATDRISAIRAAPGIFRLDQVAALKRLLVRIDAGLDPALACRELDAIEALPPRWPPWLRALGVALFAAGFAPSVVPSWGETAAAVVLGAVMGVLLVATAGGRLEGLLPVVGAFVVTVLGLTVLSGLAGRTGVTLMVLPALFIVVPGDTLSAAAGELLAGRLTAGGIRLVYAFFTLGLIVVGVIAGAEVTGRADSPR